jgi:rhodanese-related sulfurtransferase
MLTISPQALGNKIVTGSPLWLIDVRTPREYAGLHIPQAASRPLENVNPVQLARECSEFAGEVYVICQSGARARKAISRLEQVGFSECLLVEGGMSAWIDAGLPVQRQPVGVINLERQVRIGAGAMVLAGTLLGAFAHPAFLLLPGLVGAGLIFAGISDKCGMAMLLARMPWNQGCRAVPSGTCSWTK